MSIRRVGSGDLDAVAAIGRASPEAAGWAPQDYAGVARGDFDEWVAEDDRGVVGVVVSRRVADELEILNLAVAPAARRVGVGSLLLRQALTRARESGARRAYLEVRESNRGAIAFYERHGFARSGRRPRYYAAPAEDALVFSQQLD